MNSVILVVRVNYDPKVFSSNEDRFSTYLSYGVRNENEYKNIPIRIITSKKPDIKKGDLILVKGTIVANEKGIFILSNSYSKINQQLQPDQSNQEKTKISENFDIEEIQIEDVPF